MVCVSCGAPNPGELRVCGKCGRSLLATASSQPLVSSAQASQAIAPEASRRQSETGVLSPPPSGSQFATRAAAPISRLASSPNLDPGTSFGTRYRIESLLGQGGMGAVYKAYDTELDRMVALKLVRPELAASPETMQRFRQELLLASKISHKNILRIYDLGDFDGIKFITMALVDGQDLASLLESSGPLPLDRALSFATQLCAALDAAHREGVVHRDLKPQNILIDHSDKLYVSDFGLAKSLAPEAASMTRTGQLLGTPRYMSPEQVEGKEVDHRSDLYALGLILFEIFTGQLPFRGDSALQIMFQRMTAEPKDPRTLRPDLPDYISNVILKCLERDAANRYQSAREILTDLESHTAPSLSPTVQSSAVTIRRARWPGFRWLPLTGIPLAIALLFLIPGTRHLILRSGQSAQSAQPAIDHYMAILPLRIVGNNQDAGYLASGIAEVLSAKLSGLKDIYVAPTSAVSSAVKQRDPAKIARALGVKLLLQGTLASSPNGDIVIVVALDDTGNGRQLLHQEFTGHRQDLLTLEDQIFAKLIDSLEIKQSSEERARSAKRPTQDVKAYELYLKASNLWRESENGKGLQSAISLFAQAIKLDPQFALAYAGLADADRRMWNETNDGTWTQKAESAAQLAKALNDKLPEVHFTLGSIYATTGRTAEAISELQRALQLSPNSDEALRRLGNVYMQAGREQEAMAAYTRAIEINPYLWTNYNSLGNAHFRAGENEEALRAYQHIIELDPARAEGWEAVGAVYYRMGRWSECLSRFQKAVELSPKALFYSNLGNVYFFLHRYDEAATVFEKAVSMDPENDDFRVNLADSYRWSGQAAKASTTYDQAISLAYKRIQVNPKNSGALANLALSYAKKGDSRQALRFIARARSIDPKDNALMYDEGTIYTLAGQTNAALASLEEAVRSGYSVQEARNDPELKSLHEIPQFNRLGNLVAERRSR